MARVFVVQYLLKPHKASGLLFLSHVTEDPPTYKKLDNQEKW